MSMPPSESTQGVQDVQASPEEQIVEQESIDTGSQDSQELDTTPQETASWEQDKRFEQMWKKDPNQLYNSYREMEKMVPQTKQEAEKYRQQTLAYEKQVKELQEKHAQLSEVEKMVQFFESNPHYQQALMENLEKISEEQNKLKYGDLPPEAIKQLQEADQVRKELSDFKQQQETEKQLKVIDTELESIDALAKTHGIEYDQKDLLAYCKQNNVPIQHMGAVFSKFAMEAIVNNTKRTSAVETAKSMNGNRERAIAPTQSRTSPETPTTSLHSRIVGMLSKN